MNSSSSQDSVLTEIEYLSVNEAVVFDSDVINCVNAKKQGSELDFISKDKVATEIDESNVKVIVNAEEVSTVYRSYPERWGLVLTVALLNVANCAHWISFGSVNSKAAVFYEKKVEDITRCEIIFPWEFKQWH